MELLEFSSCNSSISSSELTFQLGLGKWQLMTKTELVSWVPSHAPNKVDTKSSVSLDTSMSCNSEIAPDGAFAVEA
jgi:hypothetical protein